MYRFLLGPRWLAFHLLVVSSIVLMVNLGFWQLHRLDQRQAFNEVVEARYDLPAVPIDDVLTPGTDPAQVEWRPVSVSGTYRPDDEILLVNRSQGGRPGVDTVVPLELADGRILLVNRGFVPVGEDAPPVPAIAVELTARLRPSQTRRTGQLSDPVDGVLREVQRLDLDRLSRQFGDDLAPMYVDLIQSSPPEQRPFPETVAAPVLGEANHLSYAVQWFIFSIAVAVGWVLAIRRSASTRRHPPARRDTGSTDHTPDGLVRYGDERPLQGAPP